MENNLFGINTKKYPMTGNPEYMYWGEKSVGTIGRALTEKEFFERYRVHDHEIVNSIIDYYGIPNRVLSLGCAFGLDIERFVELGVDVVGIEITKFAIDNSRVKDKIIWGSATDLSMFQKNSFDLVLALEVMEHLPPETTQHTINEIKRVGYNQAIFLIGRSKTDPTHINLRPREEWESLLYPSDKEFEKFLSNDFKTKGLVDAVHERVYVMDLMK